MKIYQCTKCGKVSLTQESAMKHDGEGCHCGGGRVLRAVHLPLYDKWYDMIERGEKKEEYRMLSEFWLKRMCYNWESGDRYEDCNTSDCCHACLKNEYMAYPFDAVVFRYGYTKRFMVWSVESIGIGQGRTEWGAPENEDVFVIKLKERLG